METYIDLDALESKCIAMRSRSAIIYCYPFNDIAVKIGAKILTRDGRVVKKVRTGTSNGVQVVVGILDGEELKWDAAGRFNGPYIDDVKDLFVPERYFFKDWKSTMKMSYSEWYATHERRHPYVNIPERTFM